MTAIFAEAVDFHPGLTHEKPENDANVLARRDDAKIL
jgi:hypothetical protein